MSETTKGKTKESLIWNTLLPIIYQVLKLGISIVIARILSPNDFGIMSIASILIFYSNSITNFGFSTAIVQRREITKDHINSIFTINLSISIILFFLFYLSSGAIASFFKIEELKPVFIALSSILIITSFYLIPLSLLRRNLSFKTVSKIEFLKGTSQSFISLALAIAGFKYWSLICGLIASLIIATLVAVYCAKWVPRLTYNKKAVKEIFSFSAWNFFNSQIRLINDYIDKLIIGKFLGPAMLGFYEKGFGLAFAPIESVSNRISGVMFSTFSRNQDDKPNMRWYLERSLITTSVICFPLFFGLFLVSLHFTIVLLGEKWIPMIGPFKIFLIAFLISSITNIFNVLNIGSGDFKKQIKGRTFFSFLLIGMCLFAVDYGISAVAFAILVYHFMFFMFTFNLSRKLLNINCLFLINAILPATTSCIIMFVLVKILSFYLFVQMDFKNLLSLSVIGAITYCVSFFSLKYKQTEFIKKEFWKLIRNIRQFKGGS